VLTTHNKMLEVQIAQQPTSSPTPLGRLPSKLESNLYEQCNYVTFKEDVKDTEDMRLEKGIEVSMPDIKKKNDEGEPTALEKKAVLRSLKSCPL